MGGMASTMRSVLPGTDKARLDLPEAFQLGSEASNVLALLSITYPIPPGHAGGVQSSEPRRACRTASEVVRFYSEVLGAAMSKTKQAGLANGLEAFKAFTAFRATPWSFPWEELCTSDSPPGLRQL